MKTFRTSTIIAILTALVALAAPAMAAVAEAPAAKCEASINGYKIRNVYITGNHYPGIAYGYKHLSDETCLTPVTDLSKADAILYIHRDYSLTQMHEEMKRNESFSVSCSSSATSTHCLDSNAYAMDINCSNGTCTSYYGPCLGAATYELVGDIVRAWVDSRWYEAEASLYTTDYKLLWKSEDEKKAHFPYSQWTDKLRVGTNSPECKVTAFSSGYKNYRQWAAKKHCGIEFDPAVSIDLKLQDTLAQQQAKQNAKDEMIQNAKEAAAKTGEKETNSSSSN